MDSKNSGNGGDASPKMEAATMDPAMMQQMMGGGPMTGGLCGTASGGTKRSGDDLEGSPSAKRANLGDEDDDKVSDDQDEAGGASPAPKKNHVPVPPSKEGIKFYSRNDVLCGRGGGTNVHPGNRRFRDLINANRRAYLRARKNDKPAISRSIVRTIREMNGRFLKKDEKLGLWFEIGDDGAREKTSQALRQRAPEMRKILFEDEQRQQQAQQQEMMMMRQRQMMQAGGPGGEGKMQGQGQGGGMSGMSSMRGGMGGGMGMSGGMEMSAQDREMFAQYQMMKMQQEREFMMRRMAMMQQMGGEGMGGMGGGGMPMGMGMGMPGNGGGESLQDMSTNALTQGGMKRMTPPGA